MALIHTIAPDKAEGDVKKAYAMFLERGGTVPKPFEMMSASPDLMKIQEKAIKYFMNHPRLGFPLLSHIRFLVSYEYDYRFCMNFNKEFLKMQGLSDEDVGRIEKDPEAVLLEDKDKAMLLFVLKAVKTPESITSEDVDSLRDMGWLDSDIYDAVVHGTNMIGPSILMKAFKMD